MRPNGDTIPRRHALRSRPRGLLYEPLTSLTSFYAAARDIYTPPSYTPRRVKNRRPLDGLPRQPVENPLKRRPHHSEPHPSQSSRRMPGRGAARHGSSIPQGGPSMLRHKWLWIVAVALLALAPIFAGEHGKKCTMSTQDCLDHMSAQMKSSGWIGLELDRDEKTGTLTVLKVVPGSPAEAAGIEPRDVLYAVNGVRIDT